MNNLIIIRFSINRVLWKILLSYKDFIIGFKLSIKSFLFDFSKNLILFFYVYYIKIL